MRFINTKQATLKQKTKYNIPMIYLIDLDKFLTHKNNKKKN